VKTWSVVEQAVSQFNVAIENRQSCMYLVYTNLVWLIKVQSDWIVTTIEGIVAWGLVRTQIYQKFPSLLL
jgi:uncharacterized membrane protein (DUF485 family)